MPDMEWHLERAQKTLTSMASDGDPTELARWGYDWWQKVLKNREYPVEGVLITESGKVVGETRRAPDAIRLTDETAKKYNTSFTILGLGMASVSRHVGEKVRRVHAEKVAPMRPDPPQILQDIERLRGEIFELQCEMESLAVLAFNTREERSGRERITVRNIADAIGYKTTQAVYDLVGRTPVEGEE